MWDARMCCWLRAETLSSSTLVVDCKLLLVLCVCVKLQEQFFFPVHWAAGSLAINNSNEKAYIYFLSQHRWHGEWCAICDYDWRSPSKRTQKKFSEENLWAWFDPLPNDIFHNNNRQQQQYHCHEHYIRLNISGYCYDGTAIMATTVLRRCQRKEKS